MADLPFDPTRVLVLVGPTGSGKSSLALALAAVLPTEIVCMDSMQIYRELKIGTTRPGPEDTDKVPHHLFGVVSVEEPLSCAQYAETAKKTLAEVQARGRVPLLVGGTGLYLRATFEGLAPLPAIPESLRLKIRDIAARKGPEHLYRLLQRLDPKGAARLHPNDRQRIQRFLEVRLFCHQSILEIWAQQNHQITRPITIGCQVDRPLLDGRIQTRLKAMFAEGWPEEVRTLKGKGLMNAVRALGPLGYDLIEDYLAGKLSEAECIEKIYRVTRRYAKRQMTWFRKVPYIEWFPFEQDSGYNVRAILTFINMKLG